MSMEMTVGGVDQPGELSAERTRPAHRVVINLLPPGAPCSPGGTFKDPVKRREREMAILRQRVEFDWRV
jgi:hypothetical protein